VLLRVLRHRLRAEATEPFEAYLRAEGIARLRGYAGVRAAHVGRDISGLYLAMSAWGSVDELMAATGREPLRPLIASQWGDAIIDADVIHWEALDLPAVRDPAPPGVLRAVTGVVRADAEASYFEYVRTRGWETLAALDGIVDGWAGRTTDSRTDRFLALTAWRDLAAIEALGALDRPIVDDASAALLTVTGVEHFTVIAPAAPDPGDPRPVGTGSSG
jgi:heme-degrading monooxygenase HmoA